MSTAPWTSQSKTSADEVFRKQTTLAPDVVSRRLPVNPGTHSHCWVSTESHARPCSGAAVRTVEERRAP